MTPRAVALTSRESWGVGGDHLTPQLQESVVPGEVLSMMTVWLTAQVSQFQRDSEVPDSPMHTDSPFNQPGVSVVPLAQGTKSVQRCSTHIWCCQRRCCGVSPVCPRRQSRRICQDQHSPQASQSQQHQKWCLVLDQGG